jgi:ribosomal protein S18 acetylase RimI-like enzyme
VDHGFHLDAGALSSADARAAAAVASRAFYDDVYFSFLFPRERARARALPLLFSGFTRHGGEHARLVAARDAKGAIVGIAVWYGPGHWPLPFADQLAQLPANLRALYRTPRALKVGATYLNAILKIHPKEPHWYLALIATEPAQQGRGVGRLLMDDGVELMKRDAVGGYLETQKEENLAFYHRFGYELKETVRPVPEGPPYYTMWKPAN